MNRDYDTDSIQCKFILLLRECAENICRGTMTLDEASEYYDYKLQEITTNHFASFVDYRDIGEDIEVDDSKELSLFLLSFKIIRG